MNLSNQDIDILEESLHQFIFSEYEDIKIISLDELILYQWDFDLYTPKHLVE